MATLQGLDRGLRALDLISLAADGLTVADLAARLEIDRAVAYRIVQTLEEHALVSRQGKRVRLGAGAATLAGRFQHQLVPAAQPVLQELADATGASAFLTLAHGAGECVPVAGAQPTVQQGPVQVGYRIGVRHPLERGANGVAILALQQPLPDEPEEIVRARELGYSITSGQLQQGATGIAVGFEVPGAVGASVGVVAMHEFDIESVAARVRAAASRLASLSTA
ncbi:MULTISPECIES: IclR family transcriptional regulator [Streptomyces]|uniref:DNA-binding IclR family transcriptional regulator n=1 Tax=Streptomyces stelliscabiei TaxID=146820 RepID=A0A8I0P192_9ACTN|nr:MULTISPECIES: helix-turn-helix domain-containing protein [Streptomyces]KND41667.1 transcriptional regulator [Streptomyces stelliscabiei]MBE1594451.1 DNA-binding IclR family transcriptional regulator [Streptomyces stelliscabiei]MDX2518890.1 helix-turn-helix domain-containing protein [Streptomyces stelliscabiei]MDX2556479.1 helix-turn-helix domain-containing protein [Streptomyces stelliscabiei]MDX2615159.1 helix-turn-helix domain-containing protein [Streptomyces stelliscabiei]